LHVVAGCNHSLQIAAETKIFALPGQHHGAYGRRRFDGERSGEKLPAELQVDRIGRGGPGERHERDVLADF
jgi:hypothetical protein